VKVDHHQQRQRRSQAHPYSQDQRRPGGEFGKRHHPREHGGARDGDRIEIPPGERPHRAVPLLKPSGQDRGVHEPVDLVETHEDQEHTHRHR